MLDWGSHYSGQTINAVRLRDLSARRRRGITCDLIENLVLKGAVGDEVIVPFA